MIYLMKLKSNAKINNPKMRQARTLKQYPMITRTGYFRLVGRRGKDDMVLAEYSAWGTGGGSSIHSGSTKADGDEEG